MASSRRTIISSLSKLAEDHGSSIADVLPKKKGLSSRSVGFLGFAVIAVLLFLIRPGSVHKSEPENESTKTTTTITKTTTQKDVGTIITPKDGDKSAIQTNVDTAATQKDVDGDTGQEDVVAEATEKDVGAAESQISGVLGLLSTTNELGLKFRMAQRQTWIPDAAKYGIKILFLVDRMTPQVDEEHRRYKDIVSLNTKYTGKAVRFGEKLYKWIVKARKEYPNASFIGKGDDDLVLCNDKLWPHLFKEMAFNGTDYVGYRYNDDWLPRNRTSYDSRMDEMFLLLGTELVDRIVSRPYCETNLRASCDRMNGLWDTNFGGTSMGLWLSPYEDINSVVLNDFVTIERFVNFSMYKSTMNCDKYLYVHPVKDPFMMKFIYNTSLFF